MMALVLAGIALAAATLSGLTGLGGGTLLIAALYALGFTPAVAVPLHAAVQLVSNAARMVAYLSHVRWSGFGLFLVGALPAPFALAPLVVALPADVVRIMMAAFLLLALVPGWLVQLRLAGAPGLVVAGALSGGLGTVVGATGLIIAPFFLDRGWPKETVIATMAVCQAAGHATKIAAFAVAGFGLGGQLDLLWPMALAVVAGTALGRWLIGLVDESRFRWLVTMILLVLACQLGVDGVIGLVQQGGMQ